MSSAILSTPRANGPTRARAARAVTLKTRDYMLERLTTHGNVQVEPGSGFSLADAAGTEITCLSGALWLTMERDSRDITLGPGDAFTIERNGLTLISAVEPSRIHVNRRWDERYVRWPRWLQLVATWLVRSGEARARRHTLSRYY